MQEQNHLMDHSWWQGRKVAVWGAGISGVSAAKLLVNLGAQVTLSDAKPLSKLPLAQDLPKGIHTVFGQKNDLGDAEILIPSPGLKPSHVLFDEVRQRGIRIMSEIELGARFTQANIIAVTGTDGKSTCTKLIAEALKAQGLWVKAVGNIGDPLCNWSLEAPSDGYLVVEVSAFQLWSTQYLNAKCAVITNIAEDHYDYFDGSAKAYRGAKLKLAYLLEENAKLFYPQERLSLDELKKQVVQGQLKINLSAYEPQKRKVESPLLGEHNQFNLSVALECIRELKLDEQKARDSFISFAPLPYRMTLSRQLDGVSYINDSKATNVHAACIGIESLSSTPIVICGGYNKGLDLKPFIHVLKQRAKAVLCIGQTGPLIHDALLDESLVTKLCVTLEVAVHEAQKLAQTDDLVLLSPAASSFDQFTSFEDRGETFDRLVASLLSKSVQINE